MRPERLGDLATRVERGSGGFQSADYPIIFAAFALEYNVVSGCVSARFRLGVVCPDAGL